MIGSTERRESKMGDKRFCNSCEKPSKRAHHRGCCERFAVISSGHGSDFRFDGDALFPSPEFLMTREDALKSSLAFECYADTIGAICLIVDMGNGTVYDTRGNKLPRILYEMRVKGGWFHPHPETRR